MRCDQAQQLISDHLDDGQPISDELRQHLDNCTACGEFERDCAELDLLLTAGKAGAPAARSRRSYRWVWALGGLAAAAILLLVVMPFLRMGVQNVRPPLPNGPQPGLRLELPSEVVDRTHDLVETVAMAPIRREMASLADDARSATRSVLACLPSFPASPATRSVQ